MTPGTIGRPFPVTSTTRSSAGLGLFAVCPVCFPARSGRCTGRVPSNKHEVAEAGEDLVSFSQARRVVGDLVIVASWSFDRLFKEASRSTSACYIGEPESSRNLVAPKFY